MPTASSSASSTTTTAGTPHKLALQVDCFDTSGPEVALVYGGYRTVRQGRDPKTFEPSADCHAFTNLLRRNGIGTTSLVLCRRDALLAVEGFDEGLRSRQDVDLYLRLAERYRFAFVDAVLVDKCDHGVAAITRDDGAVLLNFDSVWPQAGGPVRVVRPGRA